MKHLIKFQAEEMNLCWQALILEIDEKELTEELSRAEPFIDNFDEDEHRIVEYFQHIQNQKNENWELAQLTPQERNEYFEKKLADIHSQRAELFAGVRGSIVSLDSILSPSNEKYSEDNVGNENDEESD